MRHSKLKPGQKYGHLILVEQLKEKNKHGARLWLCQCVCGQQKIVNSGKVRRGDSCGCVALKHHANRGLSTGQKFGRLTILKRLDEVDKFRSRKYLCKCDCGNEKIISAHNMTNGGVRSCGCLGHIKLAEGEAALNALHATYEFSAKRRKLLFDLSKDKFRELTKQDCLYCGTLPKQIYQPKKSNGSYVYNGIDRLDPKIGYTDDNCVSCCGMCNKMKMCLSKDEFLAHIRLISDYQR